MCKQNQVGRAGTKSDGMRVTGVMPAGMQKFLFKAILISKTASSLASLMGRNIRLVPSHT